MDVTYDADPLVADMNGDEAGLDRGRGILGGLGVYAEVQAFACVFTWGLAIGGHSRAQSVRRAGRWGDVYVSKGAMRRGKRRTYGEMEEGTERRAAEEMWKAEGEGGGCSHSESPASAPIFPPPGFGPYVRRARQPVGRLPTLSSTPQPGVITGLRVVS